MQREKGVGKIRVLKQDIISVGEREKVMDKVIKNLKQNED